MSKGEVKRKWTEENLVRVNISLNRTYDADLLNELEKVKEEDGEAAGAALKRWARLGIEAEKQ